jgi:hypothetical protein
VEILQQTSGKGKSKSWQVVSTVRPLSSSPSSNPKEGEKPSPVCDAVLALELNAATGLLNLQLKQGKTVVVVRKNHWWWIQAIFVLLLPAFLWMAYRLTGYVQHIRLNNQHSAWLTEFYQKNAPEVIMHTTTTTLFTSE